MSMISDNMWWLFDTDVAGMYAHVPCRCEDGYVEVDGMWYRCHICNNGKDKG